MILLCPIQNRLKQVVRARRLAVNELALALIFFGHTSLLRRSRLFLELLVYSI